MHYPIYLKNNCPYGLIIVVNNYLPGSISVIITFYMIVWEMKP